MSKTFFIPFASNGGQQQTVPDLSQPNGSISYSDGYGSDYALALGEGNPFALPVDRLTFNGLMNDITSAIFTIQQQGIAPWIGVNPDTSATYAYGLNALAFYNNAVWQSLEAGNTDTPGATANWRNLSEDVVPVYGADSGTVNAIVVTLPTPLTALSLGTSYYVKVLNENTGSCTANIGGAGVTTIKKTTSAGIVNLTGYEFEAGFIYQLVFDGTYLQLMGQVQPTIFAKMLNNAIQSFPADNADHQLLLQVASADTFGITNVSNFSVTIPVPGYYSVYASIEVTNVGAANQIGSAQMKLYKNGAQTRQLAQIPWSGNDNTLLNGQSSDLYAAGDIITIYTRNSGTVTENIGVIAYLEVKYLGE
jgi:hypothetical protein